MFYIKSNLIRLKKKVLALVLIGGLIVASELIATGTYSENYNRHTKTEQIQQADFCVNLLIWNSCKPKGRRWFWQK